jgi:hypothetical protein
MQMEPSRPTVGCYSVSAARGSSRAVARHETRMPHRTPYPLTLMILRSAAVISLVVQGTQALPQNSFVLDRGRAGQFELGMTVDEVYKVAGRENVRAATSHRGAESRPALEIRIPGSRAAAALTLSLDRICLPLAAWGIEVHDPRFRTSNGLGVGSTLRELRRVYRSVNVVGIDTDDGAHVAISNLGVWFELNPARTFTDSSRVATV